MRIAFDARPLLGPRTGVSVWLEGLIRGLAAGTDWLFVLCLPRAEASVGLDELGDRATLLFPPVRLHGTVWLTSLAAPLLHGEADVFVGTLGILPRRLRTPSVLTVHDVTPRTRPLQHTLANRFCFNAYFEDSVARADALVCVSEATRAGLARVLPRQAASALVIGEGVGACFSPAPEGDGPRATRERAAGGRPFFVQLGTLEPRKGVSTLLAAHSALLRRRPDAPDLVLAGKPGWGGRWLKRALARHVDGDRVHLPGYVGRAEALALLRHAEAVVVASEEEGFGLPLAEALACGAACVASDDPALVELAAGAAHHVPRGDVNALAFALEATLDAGEREVWRGRARRRASDLGWERPLAAWRSLLADLR